MNLNESLGPLDISEELIIKYNKPGPRYTSYPTAPQFNENFNRKKMIGRWKRSNKGQKGISLYFHVPFCENKCLYCGCYSVVTRDPDAHSAYLSAMLDETDHVFSIIDPSREVEQMAFGGGSPTSLPIKILSGFVQEIQKKVTLGRDSEFSIEIDPRGVDTDYLDELIRLGFNRFSFGVQDLDPTVQKYINRNLQAQKLEGLIRFLKEKGIQAINTDLIYGLPGQQPDNFSQTIQKIIKLQPSRIALFGYAHVPWVSKQQRSLEKFGIPGVKERMKLFGHAFNILKNAGYLHVGMDHFALGKDELIVSLNNKTLNRNFMGYTTKRGLDLIGIGASSISSVNGTYAQNIKDIQQYISINRDRKWVKGLEMTPEDELRRDLIINLFCNFFLDIPKLEDKYKIDFNEHFSKELLALEEFEKKEMIRIKKDELDVTPLGRFFIRNICMEFDQYLSAKINTHRYSKTL